MDYQSDTMAQSVMPKYEELVQYVDEFIYENLAIPDYSDDPSDKSRESLFESWCETLIDDLQSRY